MSEKSRRDAMFIVEGRIETKPRRGVMLTLRSYRSLHSIGNAYYKHCAPNGATFSDTLYKHCAPTGLRMTSCLLMFTEEMLRRARLSGEARRMARRWSKRSG